MSDPVEITNLLSRAGAGDREALDRIVPIVYEHLRRMAHQRLRRERGDHTLNTTALVHECYVRLVEHNRASWEARSQFLAIAATTMRRILIDHARAYLTGRRGGDVLRLSLDETEIPVEQRASTLVALDAALERLSTLNPRLAQVVELRFFGGLTEEETGQMLGVTARTVQRDWIKAKGWLQAEVG